MHYSVPVLVLGSTLGPQSGLTDKLGGLPWGLPPERWPACKECEKAMSLVAQLTHDDRRLDLGAEDRVLFLFQCESNDGECATWEPESGANIGFVMDARELTLGVTPSPPGDIYVVNEARITSWRDANDDLDASTFASFFDDSAFGDLPDELRESIDEGTKLGSVPAWIQGAGEGPRGGGWRYALQIDEVYDLASGEHEQGANFGQGRAYVFLDTSAATPKVQWLWQR